MNTKDQEFLDKITSTKKVYRGYIQRVPGGNARNIFFLRTRDVKFPESAYSSAGIDFYVPTFTDEFKRDLVERSTAGWEPKFEEFDGKPSMVIASGERVSIPSGIKAEFPLPNTALIAFNKSGIATKKGLVIGACVVDSDYTGEIHISLINTSNKNVYLSEGEKAVQFILLPIHKPEDIIEVTTDDYEAYTERINSSRGEKWCGSSNDTSTNN